MLDSFYLYPELEAGTDEAGRGCLAGPVTAAAVILPENFHIPKINDSKLLSEKIRKEIRPLIEESCISYKVTHLNVTEIDTLNILNASIAAMHQCILHLNPKPIHVIVDGNRFKPFDNISYNCIVKGDQKYLSIAAASILAKTHRDELMEELHEEFPMYNWKKNKGYPTKDHREAIKKFGPTVHHRKSFKLLPDQLLIDF